MSRAPSGEQFELSHGDQRAVVVEVGGGLRSYSVAGREILDGFGVEELCSGGRGQTLIPWPNRVRDGRYEWDGSELQLDITEPARGNALHGLVNWRNWTAAERSPSRVVMAHLLHPTPGYPFELELAITYELGEGGLTVTAATHNVSDRACPYGIGWHPYVAPPGLEFIDECEVTLPAATVQIADERLIPYSSEPVEGTDFDFRAPRRFGDLVLDHCLLDLARGEDDLARMVLTGPAGSTTLWADANYPYLMVFSGDALAPPQRRRGLAVEPMTCAPNAFISGEGLIRIEPGEHHVSSWGIATS
ncbi:MAG: aldose 1-epimerase family protein [Solirubrobacteraceae bacterium]|jgi:aldose 1-epimerase